MRNFPLSSTDRIPHASIYHGGTLFGELTCPGVHSLWDTLLNIQRTTPDSAVRLSWDATMALIDAGAFGRTWEELRAEAVQELEERLAGSGEGIGSSDVNHTVVGMLTGRKVLVKDHKMVQRLVDRGQVADPVQGAMSWDGRGGSFMAARAS